MPHRGSMEFKAARRAMPALFRVAYSPDENTETGFRNGPKDWRPGLCAARENPKLDSLRLRAKPGGHQIFGAARHDQFLGRGTQRRKGE